MPGMAVRNAPERNICQVNAWPDTPERITRAAAQTIRPPIMAAIRQRYREMTHCQRDRA